MLAGGGEDGTQGSERVGASGGAQAPGEFRPDLPQAQVSFRLMVGERHGGSAQEPQRSIFVVAATEEGLPHQLDQSATPQENTTSLFA